MDSISQIFWNEGLFLMKYPNYNSTLTGYRKFRTFFGVSPNVCGVVWKLMKTKPHHSEPKHFLWSLLFLKTYNKEHVNSTLAGADEKPFREWSWKFVELLYRLPIVKWERRFENSGPGNMYVTLDGTDCRIQEPSPFNKKWFSHKFKGPGIRYEIGLSIGNGDIVWASGGLPCGDWPDLKMAKDIYLRYAKNEITLADKGYRFKHYFKRPSNSYEKSLLARHETLNGRLKQFEILSGRFRHPLNKHPRVFHACVNLVQVSINCGENLFDL